jgi:endonuclease/exonuclease/phosphatase family metal-dependent hydrolase
MRETHPDLCIFQEVDLGARRTHGEDVAQELAKTFGMNYTFAPEFRELGQSTAEGPAYHGQAILTRLPIRSSRILRFTHQSGFWKPRPLAGGAFERTLLLAHWTGFSYAAQSRARAPKSTATFMLPTISPSRRNCTSSVGRAILPHYSRCNRPCACELV